MMSKAPAAAKLTDQSGFVADSRWWLFCLLILTSKFVLLGLEPVPQLFMGDSGSYLWTALTGWIPPDRSFLYGYVIRWASHGTGTLTSLLILQAFLAALTAIFVAVICREIFRLGSALAYLFGVICSLDPLQLVWERYVMTETISLFFYAFALFFSFLYLKQKRLWQLAIVELLWMLVIAFRMSYLLVAQASVVALPIIAFWPEIGAAVRKHSWSLKASGIKSAGLHLLFSALLMFVLEEGYKQLNGRLAGREPALLHNTGLSVLTTWAPVLKPTDSPDPRLSELIAKGDEFRLNNVWSRDSQLYSPGGLARRWKQIERNDAVSNRVAKQTALNALLRRPMEIILLGGKTFLRYWNFEHIHRQVKAELGKTGNNWPKTKEWNVADHFDLHAPSARDARTYTFSQKYLMRAQPYYYVVLLSPFICAALIFFLLERYVALLCLHSWILFATITILSKEASIRYLQPMSLLTILIFAAGVKAWIKRRSQSPPIGFNEHLGPMKTEETRC